VVTMQLPLRWENDEHSLVLPDRVLASISNLDADDQLAIEQALHTVEAISLEAPSHPKLKRFLRDEPVYIFRATPEFRLFVRLEPGKRSEIVDLVSAESMWRAFNVADPFGQYP
jgi:hypothetical protein